MLGIAAFVVEPFNVSCFDALGAVDDEFVARINYQEKTNTMWY